MSVSSRRLTVLGSFMQASCWEMTRLPQASESLDATGFWTALAGKGLAVAAGCHRLGAEVDLLLAVGQDAAGDAVLAWLAGERLSTRYVRRHAGPSGQGAGWLTPDGLNAIATFQGANAHLDAQQVAQAAPALEAARLVYAQFETPPDAALAAFTLAQRAGACTVLNPSPWTPPDRRLLAQTQILLVNALEMQRLLPQAALSAATPLPEWVRALEPCWQSWPGGAQRRLVVTLGAQGSLAFAPDGRAHHAPALPVRAVDSIGAGDAFAAGLCTAWIEGLPLPQALRRGNACGAFAVSRRGILEGLPTAGEVDALLRSAA
ncbi:PfkB family carbohydrate kinase [Xenophilus sp. Marseille-Q4582]|uniref:PfkB family carbohydrate kinase n=1 Tax=Xenophilus sp. Marseille-Q4582 TaxID=2866600 RepID=UPI001CE3DC7A|nr:PfkB family carbohydrate kinase [Xenophilus sp. Marseille-Q4582]